MAPARVRANTLVQTVHFSRASATAPITGFARAQTFAFALTVGRGRRVMSPCALDPHRAVTGAIALHPAGVSVRLVGWAQTAPSVSLAPTTAVVTVPASTASVGVCPTGSALTAPFKSQSLAKHREWDATVAGRVAALGSASAFQALSGVSVSALPVVRTVVRVEASACKTMCASVTTATRATTVRPTRARAGVCHSRALMTALVRATVTMASAIASLVSPVRTARTFSPSSVRTVAATTAFVRYTSPVLNPSAIAPQAGPALRVLIQM